MKDILSKYIREGVESANMPNSPLHGEMHWRCVAHTAVSIAKEYGGDQLVALLFGLYHDSARLDEGPDEDHGPKAARILRNQAMNGYFKLLDLSAEQYANLHHAIANHTDEDSAPNPTVGACYAGDRLHLYRVGITPDVDYCNTIHNQFSRWVARTNGMDDDPPTWEQIIQLVEVKRFHF